MSSMQPIMRSNLASAALELLKTKIHFIQLLKFNFWNQIYLLATTISSSSKAISCTLAINEFKIRN